MRAIVTTTVSGRSRLLKAEDVADHYWVNLWSVSADQPLGAEDPAAAPAWPPRGVGSASWMVVSVPPVEEMKAALAAGVDGVDPEGFHLTDTVDFVVILDGEVTLVLDDESVVVQPGDLVVQRNTNHAWLNHGDKPIRLLALMMGLPE
jgi:mannose-6-phosphate isomerase-like protein (cupin superfamily)